jgi:hypothetical protein
MAMTSAFLLRRSSVAPFRAPARRGALAADLFAFPLAGATSLTGCAPSGDSRWSAAQIRAAAAFVDVESDDLQYTDLKLKNRKLSPPFPARGCPLAREVANPCLIAVASTDD